VAIGVASLLVELIGLGSGLPAFGFTMTISFHRVTPGSGTLHLCRRRVGASYWRHEIRHVKACRANPVVGHPVIDIEALR